MTEPLTTHVEDVLWRIKFGVEVSTLYHDWRRTSLGTLVNIVRAVALISAVISVGSFFAEGAYVRVWVSSAGFLAAIVTFADLAFQFDASARTHDDLYRRFKSLQADIARHAADPASRLAEWDARAQDIRVDELGVYWSIYAACWNQAVERVRAGKEYVRSIPFWKSWVGKYLFVHFRPSDFPVGVVS